MDGFSGHKSDRFTQLCATHRIVPSTSRRTRLTFCSRSTYGFKFSFLMVF